MYAYCAQRGIPTRRCGKLIVATNEDEIGRLHTLFDRGRANGEFKVLKHDCLHFLTTMLLSLGVADLQLFSQKQLQQHEPHIDGLAAIYSPHTGIVDYTQVAHSLVNEAISLGVKTYGGVCVDGATRVDSDVVYLGDNIRASYVLNCAGLYADKVYMYFVSCFALF
jgi:L-2-hydroxyglutarate oxidase LhgO